MGGKVPPDDMTEYRKAILQQGLYVNSSTSKKQLLELIAKLAGAASECPRMSCTYCEHQARSEAQKQAKVGDAEAG